MELRRGIKDHVWQQLWHFSPHRLDFPTRNFAIAEYKPFQEDICPRWVSMARNNTDRANP